MSDTIALSRALQARLEKTAARTNASPKLLVRQAIATHLDYLDWREKAIRAGFLSGKTEGWRSTEEVFAAVSTQRAKRAGKMAGRVVASAT